MTTILRLNRSHLLWWTHGKHWGFQPLSLPALSVEIDWSTVVKELFASLDPLDAPVRTGSISLGPGMQRYYVATAFCDPKRGDTNGRPLHHFMALRGLSCRFPRLNTGFDP